VRKNAHGVRVLRDEPETKDDLERDPESALNLKPTDPRVAKRKRKRRPKPLGPAPAQPPWMDPGEYEALLELRRGLR
jgi:hypothetical protein